MDAEEFVLIPLSLWNQKNSLDKTPQKNIPINRKRETSKDISVPVEEQLEQQYRRIKDLFVGNSSQIKKSKEILRKIHENPRLAISVDDKILVDNNPTGVPVERFINDLHRPKTPISDIYLSILGFLNLPKSLVDNEHALSENRGDWIPFSGRT
jgi:hypothetical protein